MATEGPSGKNIRKKIPLPLGDRKEDIFFLTGQYNRIKLASPIPSSGWFI